MRNCGPTQHGFTLIELLIALVISGLLAGVVLNIFKSQSENNELQQEYVALEQNLRAAMEVITKDLRMTGLGVADIVASLDFGDASGVLDLEGDNDILNNSSDTPKVLISNDPTRNGSDALSIRRAMDNGQRIVKYVKDYDRFFLCHPSGLGVGQYYLLVNETRTEWRNVTLLVLNNNYAFTTECDGDYDRTQFSPGPPALTSTNGLSVNMYKGTAYQLAVNSYYIEPDLNNDTLPDFNNDGIADDPALMVVRNYGEPVVLAFGIYQMDVIYFEDADPTDATAPVARANPAEISNPINIRMIQITLWGRTQHPHKIGRNTPEFRTRSLTTTIKIRNPLQ